MLILLPASIFVLIFFVQLFPCIYALETNIAFCFCFLIRMMLLLLFYISCTLLYPVFSFIDDVVDIFHHTNSTRIFGRDDIFILFLFFHQPFRLEHFINFPFLCYTRIREKKNFRLFYFSVPLILEFDVTVFFFIV